MATPLEISIALHYYCRAGDYGRGCGDNNFHAPAVKETLSEFVTRRLLDAVPDVEASDQEYRRGPALECYVEALTAIPFPTQKWSIEYS